MGQYFLDIQQVLYKNVQYMNIDKTSQDKDVLSEAIISAYCWSYGTSDSHAADLNKLIPAYDNYLLRNIKVATVATT